MAVNLSPIGNDAPFVDSNGDPLNGGKLYTYTAGSSTPQNTYTTSTGNVANANPVVLGSTGYPTSGGNVVGIWLTAGVSYKFALEDAAGTPIWTRDNISGINDTTVTIDQWVSGPAPTYISATSFSLAGDQTSTFQVGRRVKTTNAGGTIYSTITASAYGALTTITVANDSGTLDSGLSAVSYALISAQNPSQPAIGIQRVCEGRLTLTSGTPVTTADVTAAETVYFTPYKGNCIDLYDSTIGQWVRYQFSELSLDVPDATQMNDVFIYNNAGTLTLEAVAWTNTTTRATALTTQNGVLVKSGAVTRRYLGSFYGTTAGNGQTEDSMAARYLWNYYNRVARPMRVIEATNSWTYTTNAYRQTNNSAANQLDMVIGVSEDRVVARCLSIAANTNGAVAMLTAIGLDATNAPAAGCINGQITQDVANQYSFTTADWTGFPGIGRHFLAWLEYSVAAGTTTWLGDSGGTLEQSGIYGEVMS